MKEYKVVAEHTKFYDMWLRNRKWAITKDVYSIRCKTLEQLDYCASLLRTIDPKATFYNRESLPAFVRWFDNGSIGDIIAVDYETQAGEYREFCHMFQEVGKASTGQPVELPGESVYVALKRLDGHVITL
jgi:hypothetical protein